MDSFLTLSGELLCLQLHPVYKLQPGDQYIIKPVSTKSRPTSDAGVITCTVPAEPLTALPRWLSLLLSEYSIGNRPTFQHLFSPLQGGRHDHFNSTSP